MINTKLKFYSLLIFIGITLAYISVFIDKTVLDKHRIESRQQVKDDLSLVGNRLTFNLYNNIQIVKGLPALFAANPSLPHKDFDSAVEYLFGAHTQLRNIAVAPDLVIKYMYPIKGNEQAIGVDYRTLPLQLPSVIKAKESRSLVLAGPVTLVQGGVGIISRIPVYLNKPSGEEYFWGIIAAVIDANRLYQFSGLMDAELPIEIAIRGKDGLGEMGEVFWGSPQLFDQDNIRSTIILPSGSWELVARPVNGWVLEPEDMLQKRLVIFGAPLLLFLALIAFLKASMSASNANLKFHTIFEEAPLGVAVIDSLTGHIYDANPAYAQIAGRPIEELRTLDWMEITHPDDVQEDLDNMAAMNAGETSGFAMQKRYIQPDGTTRWINMTIAAMQVDDKSKPRHLCMTKDITEKKKSKLALKESEENTRNSQNQLLNVINGAHLGYWDWDYKTGEHVVNDRWLSMLGLTRQDIKNDVNDWESLIHPSDKDRVLKGIQEGITSGDGYISEFRMMHANGRWVWIQGAGAVVEYNELTHEPIRLCGTHQDITDRKEAQEKLQLSSRVFSDTHEGITITDDKMNIIDVNPAFCDITGYSREEVLGRNPRILSSGKQSPEFYQDMWQHINEQGHWQGEMWNRKKDGELYAELLTISALKDELENVVNYVGIFTDITSSKKQQEQLSLMAHYDVLTGLPNRALFTDRFTQAIAHSKRTEHQLAVCFLDLDNFKPVNDNYGHEAGDQLLIEVAKRITANIREEDTVSRQGGDEFALLLNDIESFAQCEQTLQRIHYALAKPFLIDDTPHKITASSGVTLYPRDDSDIDTLLRHADQAMYQAKLEGKHRYHLFNPEHDQRTIEKHHQLDEIEQALANNEFQLYYQPKVNMVTGKVFGAEALIRWIHPEKGLIPPLDFLPLIDNTELEIKVGNWVINQALSQLDAWNQQGIQIEVSINIASHHLLSETFFTELESALVKYSSVDSQCLQLEILESSALGDLNAISTIIETCQGALGVKVALDDFGTGYSSLTHLRCLPANTIKIDQSFVRDMLDDPSDYAIIDGIIGLSDSFNREVIAEGVETTKHGLMLLMMGCNEAQGYGISRPLPADNFPQWLEGYTPNQEWRLCGNKHRSTKENKVELFRLITDHWRDTFINNIQSPPDGVEHWPIMNSRHCPCGTWIKRAKQEQLFEGEGLSQLNNAHEALHLVAQALQYQYQEGDIDGARKGLPELQAAFGDMVNALGKCE